MKACVNHFIILFSFISTLTLSAQIPTAEWKTHLSYSEGQNLVVSSNKVYVVANNSLFSYGLTDNALEIYTKATGLHDVEISRIGYSKENETLVIYYSNGNIDLMSSTGVVNIPDFKNKTIYGSKEVNDIYCYSNFAYISTAYGILKVNIEKSEISETYTLSNGEPNETNGVVILDDIIYAATNDGLYTAEYSSPNLQNFGSWEKSSSLSDNTLPIDAIVQFQNKVIISQRNSTYSKIIRQEGTSWISLAGINVMSCLSASDKWLTVIENEIIIYNINEEFTIQSPIKEYNFINQSYSGQNTAHPQYCFTDNDQNMWIADAAQGLVKYRLDDETKAFSPKGPATNVIWDIDINSNIVRTVHGATNQYFDNTWTDGAISMHEDNEWSFISKYNGGENFEEYVGILSDPLDPYHFYVSSYSRGILEYQGTEYINLYNYENSTIETAISGSPKFVRTIGMAFDKNKNLWVDNSSSTSQLHVKNTEGKWSSFKSDLAGSGGVYSDIIITENDIKWVSSTINGEGILVYDDNNTFDDASDDQSKYFSIKSTNSDGELEFISDNTNCIVKANDGTIWVGHDNGVAVYYNPDNIFESTSNPVASRINIPRNDGSGLGDYLLEGENVKTIAVDGGNRKWLGTSSTGALLVSPDGLTVIQHFTEENSPLLSNSIRKIEINQETGEVFFATSAGLISYQSDATQGNDNFDNIKAYPNPVREDFAGEITITGLIDETIVKITDVSGNLVNQTVSNGGTATWNGCNFYGNRVGTGVYLIFCSDNAGEQSGMTKVLFIN